MAADQFRPQRSARRVGIRQSDVARAVRGALQDGMAVGDLVVTRDSVRICATTSTSAGTSSNSWDEVLDDG
jgi:uridine phosphorylase